MYESETISFLREELRKKQYYDNNKIVIEEEHSSNATISKLLRKASKTGGTGKGRPEFIIRHKEHRDWIIVNECKAKVSQHESVNRDKYVSYAVDGVLWYAKHLSKNFNVIAIALSGDKENHMISTFFWKKGNTLCNKLEDKYNNSIYDILTFDKYVYYAKKDYMLVSLEGEELKKFAKTLHNYMRDTCGLGQSEKPLLVGGVLMALKNPLFRESYRADPTKIHNYVYDAIKNELDKMDIPNAKKENILHTFHFIRTHSDLVKETKTEIPLIKIIDDIHESFPRIDDFDSIGAFYKEFLRYTGGDKQGLGIVLTPYHVTELFVELGCVTKNSVVLDICAGTAGFLIAAMYKMFIGANDDEKKRIAEKQLIGVEKSLHMYTLASCNMILRDDGKAQLYREDCFDSGLIKKVENKADIGLMNPPYSQKKEGLQEFNFIENLLDCLKVGGTGVVIVPMSCALTTNKSNQQIKKRILKKHRLDATMSMPDQLFGSIGTVTCIMVFTAHTPHSEHHKTWFGYWKDDGFEVLKHRGRIDVDNKWKGIMQTWLDAFRNKKEIPGFSVLHHVEADDEWCVEAYMETDYSDISPDDFLKEIKKYILFKELGGLEFD